MRQVPAIAAMAVLVMFLTRPLQAEVIEKARKVGDTTIQYKTVLPNGYDAAKSVSGHSGAGWRAADHEHGGQRSQSQPSCRG